MTLSGLGSGGQNALWLVYAIQSIAALAFGFSAFRLPADKRDHYLVTAAIVAAASLSYYAMATGLGHYTVDLPDAEGAKSHATRLVFYARYIDWSITTPLLLIDVLLMAKLPLVNLAWAIFADLAMVITGLIGAVDGTPYRWGWFTIGCLFMVAIFVVLFLDGSKAVEKRDSSLSGFYNSVVLGLVALWTCYPIVWALGEGVGYLSSDTETYLYGILDVIAKVGWGGFIVYNNDKLYSSYGKGLDATKKAAKKIKGGIFSLLSTVRSSSYTRAKVAGAPSFRLKPTVPSFASRGTQIVQASTISSISASSLGANGHVPFCGMGVRAAVPVPSSRAPARCALACPVVKTVVQARNTVMSSAL